MWLWPFPAAKEKDYVEACSGDPCFQDLSSKFGLRPVHEHSSEVPSSLSTFFVGGMVEEEFFGGFVLGGGGGGGDQGPWCARRGRGVFRGG